MFDGSLQEIFFCTMTLLERTEITCYRDLYKDNITDDIFAKSLKVNNLKWIKTDKFLSF